MSMNREEAINRIENHMEVHGIGEYPHIALKEALDMAITALRPVSREQVEKVWKGEWLHPHWHNSESCADCSRCNADVGHREFRGVQTEYNFCPVCGAAQNDKAVDMVMERMEELHESP